MLKHVFNQLVFLKSLNTDSSRVVVPFSNWCCMHEIHTPDG